MNKQSFFKEKNILNKQVFQKNVLIIFITQNRVNKLQIRKFNSFKMQFRMKNWQQIKKAKVLFNHLVYGLIILCRIASRIRVMLVGINGFGKIRIVVMEQLLLNKMMFRLIWDLQFVLKLKLRNHLLKKDIRIKLFKINVIIILVIIFFLDMIKYKSIDNLCKNYLEILKKICFLQVLKLMIQILIQKRNKQKFIKQTKSLQNYLNQLLINIMEFKNKLIALFLNKYLHVQKTQFALQDLMVL
ncbi:hypothetical protein IMG5_169270 [Ichthyophthirius multifiliis]|uniref:Transmembrane protein n=1 Tax=Ichthyophthirius multifiliis TaxID=5932 RepID=G0R197_ICHMU|nr:hypothetical protein IMG5_169270 [Ichthyophthirius multifiliis]EGR28730.1 hypothetical protein IMG5_169270 [Ichthyophthirius multifiliis]|eukprot:XP_004029966.1 hypothetical protein IMG5_169270 [Ichthyophthirius multifiliis]